MKSRIFTIISTFGIGWVGAAHAVPHILSSRFGAPVVNGKANVGNPEYGDMILDSSNGNFYGYGTGASWGTFATGTINAPTVTNITSCSSNYTTPTGALYLKVRIVGAGGGGAGGGAGAGSGAMGGSLTFGNYPTQYVTAVGGAGATAGGIAGNGGIVESNGVTLVTSFTGGWGTSLNTSAGNAAMGGMGGVSALGGEGAGGAAGGTGGAGAAGSGAGGGGGSSAASNGDLSGAGGGAGAYAEAIFTSPSSSYPCTIT